MRNVIAIAFFLAAHLLIAQAPKSDDLAVVVRVKAGHIALRWAPANSLIWKAGNTYGYKVERVPFSHYTQGNNDSARFRNATIIHSALLPWDRNDNRWKDLISKNRSAAFLHASLFGAEKKTTPQSKEMGFAMLMKSCDVQKGFAGAHGLMISDSSFNENDSYAYRISLNVSQKTVKCTPAVIVVNPKELTAYSKIETLKAKFIDRRAVLSFVTLGAKDYSGYWIERSEDSINYQVINKTPFIRTYSKYNGEKPESIFGDSLPQNNKKYFYRVIGINCFAENVASSNVVSGIGRDAMTEQPYIDSVTILKNSEVSIRFHMPDKVDKSTLQGYMVYRSEKRTGGFAAISGMLAPKIELYTDVKPNDANFYKIAAYNMYGDSIFSMISYAKLVDLTPPNAPAEPTGTIDSNGVVKISWQPNTEKDLLGYRVYRSNSEREQPVELTKKLLTQTTFRDSVTLKTLTREVFYTIRAVDRVHNNSAYSKYCKLIRPDKIKPIATVFKSIVPTDSSINLSWHKSNSNDVKQYKLYRKDRASSWHLLKEIGKNELSTSFSDTSLLSDHIYRYRIEVVDESGNASLTESQEILFKPAFVPKIKSFEAKADLAARHIALQWQAHNEAYNYTLYKAKDDGPLQLFKTLPEGTTAFFDKELYPNHRYRYAIKATLQSGAETYLSKVLVVEF